MLRPLFHGSAQTAGRLGDGPGGRFPDVLYDRAANARLAITHDDSVADHHARGRLARWSPVTIGIGDGRLARRGSGCIARSEATTRYRIVLARRRAAAGPKSGASPSAPTPVHRAPPASPAPSSVPVTSRRPTPGTSGSPSSRSSSP